MHDGKFVISLSGHGECGKDTAAAYFHKYLALPYSNSTSYCVVDPWWEEIENGAWEEDYQQKPQALKHIIIPRDQYKDKQAFYDGRRERRMDWVDYINAFNWSYGGRGCGLYERAVETGNQILTGIRRTKEFERCLEHLIDVSIWINRPGIGVDESQEYDDSLCDYIIDNDGDLEKLEAECLNVCKIILSDLECGWFITQWVENKLDEMAGDKSNA